MSLVFSLVGDPDKNCNPLATSGTASVQQPSSCYVSTLCLDDHCWWYSQCSYWIIIFDCIFDKWQMTRWQYKEGLMFLTGILIWIRSSVS